jgi:hypothetical protein
MLDRNVTIHDSKKEKLKMFGTLHIIEDFYFRGNSGR